MAKGDHKRVGQEIDKQGSLMQGGQDALMNNLRGSNQQFQNQYNQGLQGNDPLSMSINASRSGVEDIRNASRGGINPDAIRARALAPTKAVFERARTELDRSRRLGGASPNYAAAQAKLTRDLGYGLSDASVNAEGLIEEMRARDRALNLQGMTAAAGAEGDINRQLLGLQGMYSGNLLNSQGQLLQGQGLQNDIGRTLIQGRLGQASVPGDFQQAMGNIGSVLGLGGRIIGGFAGLGNPFSSGGVSSYNPYGYSS